MSQNPQLPTPQPTNPSPANSPLPPSVPPPQYSTSSRNIFNSSKWLKWVLIGIGMILFFKFIGPLSRVLGAITFLAMIVGFIYPSTYSFLFKSKPTRKHIFTLFGIPTIVFVIIMGATPTNGTQIELASAPLPSLSPEIRAKRKARVQAEHQKRAKAANVIALKRQKEARELAKQQRELQALWKLSEAETRKIEKMRLEEEAREEKAVAEQRASEELQMSVSIDNSSNEIIISNNNKYVYTDLTPWLNKDNMAITKVESYRERANYSYKGGTLSPGEQVRIPLNEFATFSGRLFDSTQIKIKRVTVVVDTEFGRKVFDGAKN